MAGTTLFATLESDPLLLFIMQVAITLALTRVLGKLFAYMHQPQVIGEIIAGIVLGPSVLGRIPGFTATVWPTAILQPNGTTYNSVTTFYVVANVGVILFMFLLGCELDQRLLSRQWKKSAPIALSAIMFPFGVGCAASLWLESVNSEGQPDSWTPPSFRAFLLFTGAAMSFTAFPVLASLLSSSGLLAAPIGLQALSCAAIDDILAWCVLALASSFAKSGSALMGLYTTLAAAAYVLFMVVALRPLLALLHRFLAKKKLENSRYYLSFLFILMLGSAYATEGLGIHCFFGGFMMGLIVPKDDGFADSLVTRMDLVVGEVLLPLFFANSGIRTDIGTLDSARYWGITLAIIGIACFAKFTPTCLVGKLVTKRDWRFCVTLGLLMNTRGLVEVIALNIGLSMGILSPRMFTMMILMAIVTTCITAPGVWVLYRNRREELLGNKVPTACTAEAHGSADSPPTTPKSPFRLAMEHRGTTDDDDAAAADRDVQGSSAGGGAAAAAARPRPLSAAAPQGACKSVSCDAV